MYFLMHQGMKYYAGYYISSYLELLFAQKCSSSFGKKTRYGAFFLSAQTANSGIVYLIIQTEPNEYSGLNGVVVPSLTLYKQLLHFDAFLPTKTTG